MWSSCIASLIPYAETKGTRTYEAPGVTNCAPVVVLYLSMIHSLPITRASAVAYAGNPGSNPYLNLSNRLVTET